MNAVGMNAVWALATHPGAGMKTLFLFRHAKSSWGEPALSDRERPVLRAFDIVEGEVVEEELTIS